MGGTAGNKTKRPARHAMGAMLCCAAVALSAFAGGTGSAAIGAELETIPIQIAYGAPGGIPPVSAVTASLRPTPFSRTSLRSVDVALFPKWRDAIERANRQIDDGHMPPNIAQAQNSISTDRVVMARAAFARIVASLAGKSGFDMLAAANEIFNATPHRSDQSLYGVSDHWATPIEMLAAGGGDCEDHAIAKLTALRKAGFPASQLRMVVGIDDAAGKPHAVAVAELDGEIYVLDGRETRVILWKDARARFKPLYTAGFNRVWLFRSTS